MVGSIDPFHRSDLDHRQGARCAAHARTTSSAWAPPVGQSARPSVGRIGPPGSLRRLPDPSSAAAALPLRRVDALHRAAHRAYPGDPIRSHEVSHYL